MTSASLRSSLLATLGCAFLFIACGNGTTGGSGGAAASTTGTSSTSASGTGGAGTGGSGGAGGAVSGKGLTISAATVASLDGTYDIQVFRAAGTGTGLAYNGNFNGEIEIEIDTDAGGVVLGAHVWNYTGPANALTPDKFYGCDGKATACAGVTVDTTTNVLTLGGVTWPEVSMVSFDPTMPDVLAPGGAKVTVSGVLQAM